jgi:poly-gamma-glutamate capsule biosynthesis protein CapA/YwtB (metallophosphatase superfamily)
MPAIRIQPPLRSFSVAATGDVLTEAAVISAAQSAAGPGQRYEFGPMFAPVAPILQAADLAICHMEIPIGGPTDGPGVYGRSAYGGNLVLAPFEVASGLKAAGFDRCTTSSNHSNDLGASGIESTLDALDAAGVGHVGTARSPAEDAVTTFVVNGVRVAHLGYTRTLNTTATDPWRLNYAHSVGQVVTDVAAARHLGAEVVIVSLHLGTELLSAPTPDDRAFVTDLTAATHIDLVIEHGPHVIQPLEQVNGTWVYWSVGNFVSGMGWAQSGRYADMRTLDGLIATARFVETSPGQFTVTPIPVLICDEHTSRTVYPVITTLADPTISAALRDQLQQCLARSVDVVATLR